MSPEMLSNNDYGRAVDFYCLGVLLYELLTGLPPHYSTDRLKMYQSIVTKEEIYPKFLSPNAKDLLEKLLVKEQT